MNYKSSFTLFFIMLMGAFISTPTLSFAQAFSGTYTFGSNGNVASFAYNGGTITNLTVGDLTKNGVTTSSSSGNFRANSWSLGSTDGNANAGGSIDATKYFEFTITAASGFTISNPTITFGVGRSATGPRRFAWRSSVDGYASNIAVTTSNVSVTTAGDVIETPDANSGYTGNVVSLTTSGQTTITFRFYAFGAEATTGTGGLQGILTFDGTLAASTTPQLNVTPASTNFGNTTINTPTASTTYAIEGSNLTGAPGNIAVTAPTDFQVSLNNTDFFSSINVAYTAATLASTNFYVRFNPTTGGAKTGNLGFVGGGATAASATISVSGTAVVNYYTKASTATGLQNTTSWTTDAAGGAGSEPTNFTADAQIFNIANNATTSISGNWTVSGSGSKIVVSSGDFTIPSSATVTGTVDVNAGAELTIENATLPTFGTLAATSTIQYNDVAITLPASTTYGNLTLSGTGTKTFPGNTTTITGNLVVNNTTIDAPGSSPFATILLSGNLTYQGTVVNPADANSITLQTNGTAAGTQTFTGNGNTIRYFRIQSTTANTLLMSTTGGSTNILVGNAASGGITLVDGSILNLNGNNLEFFAGGANLNLNATGSISGGATTDLIFARGGTATLGTLRMTSGANTVRSLTLNHNGSNNTNLTLGNAINVTETVTLTAGTLISNGNLTLKSTSATATANVVGGTNTSITGDVTVERFLPWASANNSGFRFVSHPLASNPVINTVTNLPTATNTLVGYNEGANAYEGISNRAGTWPQGIGYGVWTNAATTLSFTGALQLSDVSAVSMGNATQRWNFAGNPFASVLDWDAVTRTDMQNAVWVWVKDDVAVGGGAWASYIDGVAANGGSRYIAPMQGFMVRALASGTPSLAYPAAARVSNQTPSYQRTQSAGDIFRVKVSNANNSSLETVIRFLANATEDHDAAYDAEFVTDYFNGTPDLYTTDAQGVQYSINALPALGTEAVMVPLQLETFGAGSFNFTFDASEMLTACRVQLEDRRFGTFTELVNGQVVNITVGSNEAIDRFRLHFNSTGAATSVLDGQNDLIQMYSHEGALYIRGIEQAESLRILDISGRTVFVQQQLNLDGNAIRPNLAKGTYVVQLVSAVGVKTVKVIF